MLEWLVLIILIIAALILLLSFGSSGFQLFVNLVLLVTLAILIHRDINKRKMIKYYMISAVVTVVLLVFPVFLPVFQLLKKAFLIELTSAILLIFLLAYLFQLVEENMKKPSKKPLKNK